MKNKFNFTRGPWKAVHNNYDEIVFDKNSNVICFTQTYNDAKLIAAAPEMLSVLIEITDYLTPNKLNSIYCNSILHKKVNDVIEKATGLT